MKTVVPTICVLQILFLAATQVACRGGGGNEPPPPSGDDTYDIVTKGIPKFAGTDYIELAKIHRISKFRSGVGHDYWDDFEKCRSMKHYFEPKDTVDWRAIKIYAPVTGSVFKVFEEWAGTQVHIKSDSCPAFYFIMFHISLSNPLQIGDKVTAGQQLGTHIGSQTMSDIAVGVSTPEGWRLVSYLDVITDGVFGGYQLRGLNSRSDAIISKDARDADVLTCSADTFTNSGTIENWVVLN